MLVENGFDVGLAPTRAFLQRADVEVVLLPLPFLRVECLSAVGHPVGGVPGSHERSVFPVVGAGGPPRRSDSRGWQRSPDRPWREAVVDGVQKSVHQGLNQAASGWRSPRHELDMHSSFGAGKGRPSSGMSAEIRGIRTRSEFRRKQG